MGARKKYYDGYDPDEAFSVELRKGLDQAARQRFREENPGSDYERQSEEQKERLREWELERLLREGKIKGIYRTTTYKARNIKTGHEIIESCIYPAFARPADVPRKPKKRVSKTAQKNLNDKNARRKLTRLININFGPGDLWCTFGWKNKPTTERAKKDIENFFKRLNRLRKKRGLENARWVYILAFDDYTRPHVHLVIDGDIDRDTLEALWGKDDRPNTRRIRPDSDAWLSGMASYMARNPHGSKRWSSSKNLKRVPEPTKSYSKFSGRRVNNMARDYEECKAQLERAYPGYTYLDAEIRYNTITAAFYIYARLTRD